MQAKADFPPALVTAGAKPKVLITNATRLHAHHHAVALQKAALLQRFVTSIWWKPGCFPYRFIGRLPAFVRKRVVSFLAKRKHPDLRDELVEQRWAIDLARLAADSLTRGRFRDWILFAHKGAHDRMVARRVAQLRPDVVVGYEISCSKTFQRARELGAVTVLDVAGLHHDFTDQVAIRHSILGQRSSLQRRLGARKRRELELADHVLVISDLARKTFEDAGVAPERISIVHLGVALETFKAKEIYRREGRFRLLFVGNLSRAKGVDVLVEAIILSGLPDFELTLVGAPGDAYASVLNNEFCTHIPFLDHESLAALYRDTDIFILPTLYDSWGLVVTEAMASGTPVIVTEHCGAKELVTPECGWIVQPANAPALAAAIRSAFGQRGRLEEMGRNARTKVEAYEWSTYQRNVADHIMAFWSNVQDSKRPASERRDGSQA